MAMKAQRKWRRYVPTAATSEAGIVAYVAEMK
jgi:hypothetical protein